MDTTLLEEALAVISDFVIIAINTTGIRSSTSNHLPSFEIDLERVIYVNEPLRKHLMCPAPTSDPLSSPSGPHPPIPLCARAKLYNLTYKDGKYEGKACLSNYLDQNTYFFASGVVKNESSDNEKHCIFKLTSTRDENYLVRRYFDSLDSVMTVFELSPDLEAYEWRHLVDNKFFLSSVTETVLRVYNAASRFSLEDRQQMVATCLESKRKQKSVENKVVETKKVQTGQFKPYGIFIHHIYTDEDTGTDVYGSFCLDPIRVKSYNNRKFLEMSNFFQNAPMMMGVTHLNKDNTIVLSYANKFAAKNFFPDIPEEDLQDIPLTNRFPPDLMTHFIQMYKQSRDSSTAVEDSIFIPELNLYWDLAVSCLTMDADRDESTHGCLILDKTAQKLAELELERHKNCLEETVKERTRELQEEEQRFRSLVSNAPNIILSIDRTGKIEFANRNFVSDDPRQIVGKYLHALVVEGADVMVKINTLFATKKSFITEVKLLDYGVWLNLSVGPINDNLAITVATDITKMKQMSDELHHALNAKSSFLANMSHEVRTPLSGIIGMSRILMESGLTMDQTECVATIQYCGETLLSVINSILDYTKLEATGNSSMAIDQSELSLLQCVEESVYTILPAAQKKKLELIIDIDTQIPERILGDVLRLRQVLVNLLNNAVKFTDEGFILVSITGSALFGTDDWKYNFTIQDTGCGVPPDSQRKLFQMFSQVDVSTTRRFGGTGIGLALAKRFLEMMGGEITMESSGEPGKGSTFYFSITATIAPFAACSPSGHASPRWLAVTTAIYIIVANNIAGEVLKKRLVAKGFMSVWLIDRSAMLDDTHVINLPSTRNAVAFCDMELLPVLTRLFQPNPIATVLMAYVRPKTFDSDQPNFEFLRKPIKEAALVRCLREIWNKFDNESKQKAAQSPPCRTPSLKKFAPQVLPLKIMVVEDNEINQKVARRVFQHLGYKNIEMANNGKEALDLIANAMPDLILMDVQMPILDGMQTTKILRNKYPDSPVYIVAMTANAFPEDRKTCLDAGMNDFLTKPIRVEQLQTTIQKCYQIKTTPMAQSSPTHINKFSQLHISV